MIRQLQSLIAAAILVLMTTQLSFSQTYNCDVPPIVGFGTRPNVMMVMDYSGSMQLPAYLPASDSNTWGYFDQYKSPYGTYNSKVLYSTAAVDMPYDPGANYYGYFDSASYYQYDATNKVFKTAASPVTAAFFSQPSFEGAASSIWFTAPSHGLSLGEYVVFSGLTSHTGMNGNPYKVLEVNGDRFRVGGTTAESKWNGVPDLAQGSCIERILGTFSNGISGNLLNFFIMSRMDASMKALIGGKADCSNGTCLLRTQGSKRWIRDSNHTAMLFVRPGDLTDPDNYATGSYLTKDIYLSVLPQITGKIDLTDPLEVHPGSTIPWAGYHAETWYFTLTQEKWVDIVVEKPVSGFVGLSSKKNPVNGVHFDYGEEEYVQGGYVTHIQRRLPAGTYSLQISIYQWDLATARNYSLYANVDMQFDKNDPVNPNHDGLIVEPTIGRATDLRAVLNVPEADRTGVVQETFDFVRFGLMYYYCDPHSNNGAGCEESSIDLDNAGKILVGCDNKDLPTLVNAFSTITPYQGTPTGPALDEAYKYFSQTSTSVNPSYISTAKDPYKDTDANGKVQSLDCRKSYVLLISDGEWTSTTGDPVPLVAKLRRGTNSSNPGDIRPLLIGDQTVKTFGFYTFGSSAQDAGATAMKWVSMFGGFNDRRNCPESAGDVWPYPKKSADFSNGGTSANTAFAVSECPAGGVDECCAEWDANRDGIPDAFYDVRKGDELSSAVTQALATVRQANASASAVATMTQQLDLGDIIIRGMFEVTSVERLNDLTEPDYLWFGHLEVYWPFKDTDGNVRYDFELGDELCWELDGSSRHCWDVAQILNNDNNRQNNRRIFTFDYSSQVMREFNTTNITAADLGLVSDSLSNAEEDALAQSLVKWVLGDTETPSVLNNWRVRGDDERGKGWVLGDVVYSTPVVVDPPRLGAVSRKFKDVDASGNEIDVGSYLEWRMEPDKRFRDKFIYVGANDGMLHAILAAVVVRIGGTDETPYVKWVTEPSISKFEASLSADELKYVNTHTRESEARDRIADIGREIWAYIPSNLLSQLKLLADKTYGTPSGCSHRSMVDLAPESYEVYFHTDNKWRSIIIGGERGGGDIYFAIDVTDPHTPQVIWEYKALQDVVLKFDFDAAGPAFTSACGNLNFGPMQPGQCYMPLIPSAWFNTKPTGNKDPSRCLDCWLDDTAPIQACTSLLKHYFDPTKWYVPLSHPDVQADLNFAYMSWTKPALGRLYWPAGLSMCTGDVHHGQCTVSCDEAKERHIIETYPSRTAVFMGVGFRPIKDNSLDVWPADWPQFIKDGFGSDLFKPYIVALDIETGVNMFRYLWGEIHYAAQALYPKKKTGCDSNGENCANEIPYSLSDMTVMDLLGFDQDGPGEDDYVDHIYVGDLNGYFYGMKINFDDTVTGTANKNMGIRVDMWPTKPIHSLDLNTNLFRSDRQPIASQPAVAYDRYEEAVRIIFGGGKYESVSGDFTDKSDTARMSVYNLKDPVELPAIDPNALYGGELGQSTKSVDPLVFQVVPHCMDPNPTYRCNHPQETADDANCLRVIQDSNTTSHNVYGCSWVKVDDSTPDCCERDCSDPCWDCVFDLIEPGERVINKPVIAGGLIIFTTLEPTSNPCAGGGYSYIYFFDYACNPFPPNYDPTSFISPVDYTILRFHSGDSSNQSLIGARVSLGFGIPSQPVLDSTGDNVIIQKSDGTVVKLKANLLEKRAQVRGWMEKQTEK